MKKNDWISGIIISAGISALAAFPRMLRMEHFDWLVFLQFFGHSFLFSFMCWCIHCWLTGSRMLKKYNDNLAVGLLVVLLVALTIYPYNYLFSFIYDKANEMLPIPESRRQYMLLLRGVVTSGLFYFILYHKLILTQKQESQLEIERLKQAQLEVSLSSLKEQLSPHFLFNTLNTLSTLTQEKPVKEYVNELSNIYRHVLQHKQQDTVTLAQELDFIGSYIYILKSRFESAIVIDNDVPAALHGYRIPAMTLQLLIENAVKHNMATSYKPLLIKIGQEGEYLVVSNNLQPKSSTMHSTGTGLHNITLRYRLLFNKEIMIDNTGTHFVVKLPLTV